MLAMPLDEVWLKEQLEQCEKATPGPWVVGTRHSWGWPVHAIRDMESGSDLEAEQNRIFIAATRSGYPLVLKELRRLKQVIYRAVADLAAGESGHAMKTLDDDREPGTKSYYD